MDEGNRTGAGEQAPPRWALTALFAALAASASSQSFVFAVLPPLGRSMAFTDVQTSAIITVAAIAFVLVAPVWGAVSERWGRRNVILLGMVMASVSTALFGAVIQFRLDGAIGAGAALLLLIGARLVLTCFTSGVFPAAQAYVADVTPAERRASGMALISSAFALGSVAGPAIAWAMSGISLVAPFYGMAVLILGTALAVAATMREPDHAARPEAGARDHTLNLGTTWRFLLSITFGVTSYAVVMQVTALRLQDLLGLTAEQAARDAGAALMVMAVAMILSQGLLVRKLGWDPSRLLRRGVPYAMLAMLGLTQAASFTHFMLAMALYGVALGLVIPGNFAALSLAAGRAAQGRIAGLAGAAQGIGMVVGPMGGAALYQLDPVAPFVGGAVLLALVCLLVFMAPVPKTLPAEETAAG